MRSVRAQAPHCTGNVRTRGVAAACSCTCTARACPLLRTRGRCLCPAGQASTPAPPLLPPPPTNPKGRRPCAAWDTPSVVVPLLCHPCQVGCPGLPELHCSQQSHAPRPGILRGKTAAKESRNFTRSSKDVRVRRTVRSLPCDPSAKHSVARVRSGVSNRSASNNVKKEKVRKEREGEGRGDNVDTVQTQGARHHNGWHGTLPCYTWHCDALRAFWVSALSSA